MVRRRRLAALVALAALAGSGQACADTRWAVYYADRAVPKDFSEYALIIFDSDNHPSLAPLKAAGKVVLGYLSLGEVASSRAYYQAVRDEGLLLQENEVWKGSFFVDVRDPRWSKRVLDQLVPGILARGFDGVFLDTLDNPGHVERLDPVKYRGMAAAAVELIRSIHRRYPSAKIMMNRAYDLLPQVERDINYALAESVFTTYDFQTKRYVPVSKPLYEQQVALLKAAKQRRPELQVFTLDYWDPDDQDGIRGIYAEERKNGFNPYVATISLDRLVKEPARTGAVSPAARPAQTQPADRPATLASEPTPMATTPVEGALPRTILALYDSRYMKDTALVPIHQVAEMPLNHLGLIVRYHDVNKPLPSVEQLTDVRGVLTWFQSDAMADPRGFLKWAGAMLDAGKRFLVVGDLSVAFDLKRARTPQAEVDEFWSRLGLKSDGSWRATTYDWKIAAHDDSLVGFERSLGGPLSGFPGVTKIDPNVKSYLTIRRGGNPATDVELVAIGPRGAYAAPGYLISEIEESQRRQWYVNPFEFFRTAFETDGVPKPDTTTISGRRIFYSHVDGDGWRNLTQVQRYKKKEATAADVILDDVLRAYPDLPVTVAPIAGDLDPAWFGSDKILRTARAMFALPHVEAGSHTYGHPLAWGLMPLEPRRTLRAAVAVGLDRFFGYQLKGQAGQDGEALNLEHLTKGGSRTYNVEPFSLDLEIGKSIAYITALVPSGKQVRVLQWSGDTTPPASAIAATRALGVRNLNGGDTRFDPEFPSYGWVRSLGRQVGDQRQVYSSASNENTYTSGWTERFFGFRYLQATLKNTESPVRVKPHNIYYHMFSGEKLSSLTAVLENYEYARTQELAPITASDYAAIVDGFYSAQIVPIGDDRWRIENRDGLQTIRFDGHANRFVDFSQSHGVIGQREYQGSLYVALDSSDISPIVALAGTPSRGPYLVQSRWLVSSMTSDGDGFVFSTRGFGGGESAWHVAPSTTFRISVTSKSGTVRSNARSDEDGLLTLSLAPSTNEPFQVSVTPAREP